MSAAIFTLIGVFIGAWVSHRARNGQSPLPTLPKKKEQPKPEPAAMKLPEVRP